MSLLSFRLFRIPVTIRPSFLIVAALIGFVGRSDPLLVLAWVAIVFFSILIHELGHAFTARSMGATVAIELNGLGGLTRWGVATDEFGPGRRALVAASGSAVGVAFGAGLWLVAPLFGPFSAFTEMVIDLLIRVNVFWGLLNWVPIRPLDGGHLLLSLLQKVSPARAESIARVIFTVTSGVALIWAFRAGLIFIAVLAGWMLLAELTPRGPAEPPPPIPDLSYDEPVDEEPPHTDHG